MLYRYILGFNRSANLEGVFYLSQDEVEFVASLNGMTVYYGEIAGKHSDVTCKFDLNDLKVIDADDDFCKKFQEKFPSGIGFKFKNYWIDYLFDRIAEKGFEEGRYEDWTLEEGLEDFEYQHPKLISLYKQSFLEGRMEREKN